MKILIISPYIPWPLYSGSCVRIFNLLKQMSLRGHKIFLLAGQNNLPLALDCELADFCEKIYTYKVPILNSIFFIIRSVFSPKIYPAVRFQSSHFKKILNNILSEKKINLVWVNFSIMADMLPAGLNKTIPVILDQHESERLVYYGYLKKGNLIEKIFALINIVKLKKFEEKVFSKIDVLVCVSEEEAIMARKYTRKEIKFLVVPNGVDEKFFNNLNTFINKKNRIIFCANMAVRRNIDAAVWFAKRIFPQIKKQIFDAEFWIVGSWPSAEILKLNSISGVRVIGMVKDIKKYYAKGKVFVAPYHFAAGSPLKVLEAMASGVPVVSTNISSQGIDVTNNKNIIIANNETDFCNNVIELLSNPQKAKGVAVAGQNLIKEKYTWNKIVTRLEPEIFKLIEDKQKIK